MSKRLAIAAWAVLLLAGISSPVATAAEAEGVQFVTTDELKSMMDRGEQFVLINALSPLEFTQTKIEGSINIPYGKLSSGEASLPEGRAKPLVFYCLGPN